MPEGKDGLVIEKLLCSPGAALGPVSMSATQTRVLNSAGAFAPHQSARCTRGRSYPQCTPSRSQAAIIIGVMNRRAFLATLIGGAAVIADPERLLWTPTKTIFIPPAPEPERPVLVGTQWIREKDGRIRVREIHYPNGLQFAGHIVNESIWPGTHLPFVFIATADTKVRRPEPDRVEYLRPAVLPTLKPTTLTLPPPQTFPREKLE